MNLNLNSSSHENKGPVNYSLLLDKVFDCINDQLLILMNQLLTSADKKLLEQAEKAKNDDNRSRFMDCAKLFRAERNTINQHFLINLNKSLKPAQNYLSEDDNNCDSDKQLSHVSQDEMEEMVAITTMHAKAMNIYGVEVNHLEARLEYLEIVHADSFDKEALDPKHICEIFQKTIEKIDFAIEVKLMFYKLFDQQVCSKLGLMYKSINQLFIDNGILPEIVMKTTKQEEVEYIKDEACTQVASYYDPSENISTNFIPRTKDEISRVVNEFMTGGMTISGDEIELPESFLRAPTKHDLDGKSCYDRKEVVKALSKLQHKLSSMHETSENLSAEDIKKELINNISDDNSGRLKKQVNLLHERSIDFVGMMFGAIADDNTVTEIMTNLIYQLQVPVMKIAMSDDSLFEDEEHPARTTVDLLTTAGKGINNENDRLYEKLESIVDEILDHFDTDIDSFEKAADALQKVILQERALTEKTERKQQQKILQEHARHIVITQIKMALYNKKIPNEVRPLVLKHWSTLMLNHYIRHGRDSQQWMQSVLLLKLLLKCMQPIHYPSQLALIKNNHIALIEAVNDELYETQQDKNDIRDQIITLKSYLLKMIDDYDLKIIDANDEHFTEQSLLNETAEDTQHQLQQMQDQITSAKQKIAQLSSSTRPGVWYEIYNGEDKAVRRLKLSVILADAAQLIFVDRKGMKVIEKDAAVFAKELEENRSRVLADHSTFDHALGKVMNAIAA